MYFKDVRFHNTEDLIKLKVGKSDKQKSANLNDVSDDEYIEIEEEQTVNEENEGNSTNKPEDSDENNNASSSEDSDNSDEGDPFKTNTEDRGKPQSVTKSGRISYAPKYMLYNQDEASNTAFKI